MRVRNFPAKAVLFRSRIFASKREYYCMAIEGGILCKKQRCVPCALRWRESWITITPKRSDCSWIVPIARSRGNLILDFAHVTLMDSSGIGLLIGRYKKLKEKGMRLFVKNVNPYVDKLFRMSGLYNIIEKIS